MYSKPCSVFIDLSLHQILITLIMNKFTRKMMLAIACIIAGCINVQAQQIKGDFDVEWITDTIGNGALPGQFLRPGDTTCRMGSLQCQSKGIDGKKRNCCYSRC